MKLFTVGPTQMFDDTFEVGKNQLPYFRTDEFSQIVLKTVRQMKTLLKTKEDTKIIYITGSGSAAMESVVSNSFDSNDKLLIINGGTFGQRFVNICEIYNIPYEDIKLKYNEVLTREKFENYDLKSFTALLVNIDETSTCQLYDINLLKQITKENNMYLIVDAISSFLADEFNMDDNGIDCTILSSQKALSISPGLSILAINNKFYEDKIKDKKPINLYLNINEHIKDISRGQTPNTPAVGIILELSKRLDNIKSADDEVKRVKQNADFFRKEAKKVGFQIPSYPLSNAVTPIICPKNNAMEIFNYLKDKYNIFVNPTGGILHNKVLRISHIGNLSKEDYIDLLNKMKEVM